MKKGRSTNNPRVFKQAFEEAGHAIFITDHQGTIDFINSAFSELTGFKRSEAVGKPARILNSGRMPSEYFQRFWEAIASGKTWEEEIINRKKNGDLYFAQQTVSPILGQRGGVKGYIAVQKDITPLKHAETQLKLAKEAAESANKAKSEFLANMSHEIRTPLNAILGFSELLEYLVTNKKQKDYLESIQTAGKSLLTLINDILDLSKIEAGKMELNCEPVNPSNLASEMKQIFAPSLATKNLEFFIKMDPQVPTLLILDESRIRQVLLNLIGNAVKFTDQGFISLDIALEKPNDAKYCDIAFSVEDSGIGIPESQQSLIFDSFNQQEGQSSRKYGGTGLGLSICKRLVGLMGGEISLNSDVGVGSTFRVVLRKVKISKKALSEEAIRKSLNIKSIRFEPASLLIVDDSEPNRFLLQETLSQAGFDLLLAENGMDAFKLAKKHQPPVILMDIRMPKMDGFEAIRRLKSHKMTRDIAVIAMTASVMPETIAKIKTSYFDGFLPKPASLSEILEILTQFIPYQNVASGIDPTTGLNQQPPVVEKLSQATQLLAILKGEVLEEINILSGVMEMSAIQEFSQKLSALGQKHQASSLVTFADFLGEYADEFDIAGLQRTFSQVQEFIAVLDSEIADSK